jgi:bacteriorhodopsin
MPSEALLHWIYVALMASGALLFLAWMRNPRGVPMEEYVVAILIPVWSGIAYAAMAMDFGKVEAFGQTAYWARYADWVVTTPLLLVALAMTATFYDSSRRLPFILTLVGADVMMIVCGLVADLMPVPARWVFYAIGVGALVAIFYVVWGPLRREAFRQGPELGGVYTKVAAYLTLFWVGYPLTWLLGPSGLGLISQYADTLLFVVLPFFSKVGFSVFDLHLLRRLPPSPLAEPALQRAPVY